MEILKDLGKLAEPDSRNLAFAILDPSLPDGKRPITDADRHGVMAGLDLPDSVPETIRSAFAVTRTLWVYGWFYWPFYTLAEFHALLCLDMALATRIAREDNISDSEWHSPPLAKMLKRAIESGWVTDDGIAHARRLREQGDGASELLPPELARRPPDTSQRSHQRYCRILLDGLPDLRNYFAHPKHYWHTLPSALGIENVHGLVVQLFPTKDPGREHGPR